MAVHGNIFPNWLLNVEQLIEVNVQRFSTDVKFEELFLQMFCDVITSHILQGIDYWIKASLLYQISYQKKTEVSQTIANCEEVLRYWVWHEVCTTHRKPFTLPLYCGLWLTCKCVSHLQNGKHDEAWMILKQVHDTNMRAKGYPERVFSVSHTQESYALHLCLYAGENVFTQCVCSCLQANTVQQVFELFAA